MEPFKFAKAFKLMKTMFAKKSPDSDKTDIQITEEIYDDSFSGENDFEIAQECTDSKFVRPKKIIRNLYNRQESLEQFADSHSSISSYCFSDCEAADLKDDSIGETTSRTVIQIKVASTKNIAVKSSQKIPAKFS